MQTPTRTRRAALQGKRAATSTVTRRIFRICASFFMFFVLPTLRVGPRQSIPPHVRLRLFLQHLGGAWVKIGQSLAMRFDLLPREYCSELLGLLSNNPAIDYALVRQVIQEDMGQPPELLFASFEVSPIATASVAQVHVARAKNGLKLAIKVQQPAAQTSFEADFRVLRILVELIGVFDCLVGPRSRPL